LAILHNKLKFIKTINRQYDSQFARAGAKIGTSLLIREPNQFTVRTGAVMQTQDIAETSQTLTLATQKGVDVNFSSVELTMSLDDFAQRILEPMMSRLAAEIEFQVLLIAYKDIFNMSGTPATTPASLTAVLNGGVKISQGLAPDGDRHLLLDSVAMAAVVASVSAFFHKASEIERAFSEGYMGQASGFKWWESNMVPNHTNGDRTDTTPLVNTSTGITSGTAVITMTGFPDGLKYKKGDIFTIADVFAVNLETKQRYSHLQQWVVTADETETGTGDMTPAVSPTPQTSGAKQNIELVSAGASKAVVNLTGGGSGAADLVFTQDLAYHRDAFTFVTADLEMPKGVDFAAREVFDGISLRIVRDFDITNDKFPARIDVLYGFKTIRPEWACRVRG
ncbi:hypothetical protein LCGC14_2665150, partial [marine sediment metagenome]